MLLETQLREGMQQEWSKYEHSINPLSVTKF